MKILMLLSSVLLFSASAYSDGRCTARDSDDSYAKMVCPNRSSGGEHYCEYNDDCVWTETPSGSCGARDRNDSYAKMVCPNRSSGGEHYCEYNDDCRWYP